MRGPSVQDARHSTSGGVLLRVQLGPLVSCYDRNKQRLPLSVLPGKALSTASKRSEVMAVLSRAFGRQVVRNVG